jgi:hypothetical protein
MSQTQRLYNLLLDGKPYRTDRIMELVYGGSHLGIARIGARKFDIEKKYKVTIKSWPDPEKKSLWWYQMEVQQPTVVSPAPRKDPSIYKCSRPNCPRDAVTCLQDKLVCRQHSQQYQQVGRQPAML